MSSANITVPLSEPTTLKENDNDERANAEVTQVQTNGAAPKDLRFWLIIFSLLIATFISALDLTGMAHLFLRAGQSNGA